VIVVQVPDAGLSRSQVAVAFQQDPLGFLLASARSHGPVVQLCPGTVMVTGHAEALSVLRASGEDFFPDRNFLNHELTAEKGSAEEKTWLAARRAAVAQMTPDRVGRHMEWFVPRTESFVDGWLHRGTVPSMRRDLETLTAESIARFCLGASASPRLPLSAQALLDALFPTFASPYRFPPLIRRVLPRERRVRRALGDFQAVLGSELARLGPAAPSDSLAAALRAAGLDDDALLGLLRSLMLAAHDVPASALAWTVTELARSEQAQDAIADAAASWDGIGPPPPEVAWFVDEVLRLWPPTWGLSRKAGDTAHCGRWQIPPGSTVIIPLWVLHRVSPSYTPSEPERFDHARWQTLTPRAGEYLPFSGGPHWCPGERLARAELAAMVAVLSRRARLRLNGQVTPDIRRTLTPRGFELEVSSRHQPHSQGGPA
jgi:cytochrome P450